MSWLRSLLSLSPRGRKTGEHAAPGDDREENRYYGRFRTGCRIRLTWQDDRGKARFARARVVDMNGTGALVECSASITPGQFVFVQTRELGRMGSAVVRRCAPGVFSSQIGLQFTAPLTHRF
jgi:PilZ domain-containing protein